MSKFKVGDKVRVLDGSKIKNYTGTWCAPAMEKYVGQVCEISDVFEHYIGKTAYNLKGISYAWDERGLEPAYKFKVGDKVIGNEHADDIYFKTVKGWVGIVTENDPKKCDYGDDIRVRAIDEPDGANFSVKSVYFDLYEEPKTQKIVITTDGKTTMAVLYDGKKRIKEAKATCAPTDTFDFGIGSALAIERLMGNPKATLPENEKSSLDWKKFAAGKLEVKVNKEKFDEFMKLCEERNFKWALDKAATKVNPWKLYDEMPDFLKSICKAFDDIPREHLWICFEDENELKFGTKHKKDVDEYEFV